jgi:sporulation protein YhbH
MSIFREHKTIADRSASDRSRHKKKIEKAIKEGIHNIVAEESIISQEGNKRINIPVRGIKEYRFIYGENKDNKQVGSAPGKDVSRGQKVGEGRKQKGQGQGNKGSNEKGEEYYEVEITLEELAEYLFADLELPDLARKTIKNITGEKWKRHGYRNDGIRPRLDKKKTAINRIKRKKAVERLQQELVDPSVEAPAAPPEDEERFPYHENDLIYRHIKKDVKESSNAVIFFLMDISGSMSQEKKFLSKSFYFLLYHFINSRYKKCDVVFVAHDTEAYEVDEDHFFKRGNSGGTIVSSGLRMVKDIIDKRYHPNSWNIYCFQCSDGDNWSDDNEKAVDLATQIRDVSQLFGYCQVEPRAEKARWESPLKLDTTYMPLVSPKFKMAEIGDKSDIWPAFKALLGKRVQVSG